jgi:hypothetical protein
VIASAEPATASATASTPAAISLFDNENLPLSLVVSCR